MVVNSTNQENVLFAFLRLFDFSFLQKYVQMFPKAAPAAPARTSLPPAAPVSNWSVALYRKAEPIIPLNASDASDTPAPQQTNGSFYVQLQQQAASTSPSRSDVLYFRYQAQQQRNSAKSYTLPFTVTQLSDMKLSADSAPIASTSIRSLQLEQQAGRKLHNQIVLYIDRTQRTKFCDAKTIP